MFDRGRRDKIYEIEIPRKLEAASNSDSNAASAAQTTRTAKANSQADAARDTADSDPVLALNLDVG